ncbi:hypothetical protein GGX14DRAFT_395142 [Mycena pura]|uniref:Uncharacterized protein n=1 Tax=Mycena pura TaxID=153505 RepID=A0AAD6VDS9_9AGAR|nr:hypothetical protein GGX14DRAFT_395142 [Mycena pura]
MTSPLLALHACTGASLHCSPSVLANHSCLKLLKLKLSRALIHCSGGLAACCKPPTSASHITSCLKPLPPAVACCTLPAACTGSSRSFCRALTCGTTSLTTPARAQAGTRRPARPLALLAHSSGAVQRTTRRVLARTRQRAYAHGDRRDDWVSQVAARRTRSHSPRGRACAHRDRSCSHHRSSTTHWCRRAACLRAAAAAAAGGVRHFRRQEGCTSIPSMRTRCTQWRQAHGLARVHMHGYVVNDVPPHAPIPREPAEHARHLHFPWAVPVERPEPGPELGSAGVCGAMRGMCPPSSSRWQG